MKPEFVKKVIAYGSVDTKKYRYVAKECSNHEKQWIEIRRLPLELLDTTAAIDGWETVKQIG